MIAAERARQLIKLGFDDTHDTQHTDDELSWAAIAYATDATRQDGDADACGWPWNVADWKPRGPITDLVRAGALLAAEIDRRMALGERPEAKPWQ